MFAKNPAPTKAQFVMNTEIIAQTPRAAPASSQNGYRQNLRRRHGGRPRCSSRCSRADFAGATFVAVNTEARRWRPPRAPDTLHLETKLLRGLGTGGDPERGAPAAEEHLQQAQGRLRAVRTWCSSSPVWAAARVRGISPVLARAAHEDRRAGAGVRHAAVRLRGQSPPAPGAGRTRTAQSRRRRRHLSAVPESLQAH